MSYHTKLVILIHINLRRPHDALIVSPIFDQFVLLTLSFIRSLRLIVERTNKFVLFVEEHLELGNTKEITSQERTKRMYSAHYPGSSVIATNPAKHALLDFIHFDPGLLYESLCFHSFLLHSQLTLIYSFPLTEVQRLKAIPTKIGSTQRTNERIGCLVLIDHEIRPIHF